MDVLARLGGLEVGKKLKYDDATGRFDIDNRFLISRMTSDDSVTSKTHFSKPMTGLLRAAQERLGAGTMTQDNFDAALRGLAKLRRTYAGSDVKLRALDEVLKSIPGLAQQAREGDDNGQVIIRLRTDYRAYLFYAVRQMNYIDVGQFAVCNAFVIDWGRRLLSGKETYAHSKKRDAYAIGTTLGLAEHARMQKKVDRVAVLQAGDRALEAQGQRPRRSFPGDLKYGRVQITGDRDMRAGEIPPAATGREIFQEIIRDARRNFTSGGSLVLMVRLDGDRKVGSHMLGIHLYGEARSDVHFFDPNVGEFKFMRGSEDPFWRFCNALMAGLYTKSRKLIYDSWVVNRLYLNPR
jgi:hypothetical protein